MSDLPQNPQNRTVRPETLARVKAIWERVGKEQDAKIAENERQRLADVAKIIPDPLNHSDDVVAPEPVTPVNPPKTITIDGMIKALNRIKAKQFKGNGKVPLKVHVEEQDVIYSVVCVGTDANSDDERVLVFCGEPDER